jgi:SAM-dependent methyltransferase
MRLLRERDGAGAMPSGSVPKGVYSDVEAYYSARVAKYGATPLGVDWSCQATQNLRFVQLLKLCDFSAPFALNDIGCGYGALAAFMSERYPDSRVDYLGVDLSDAMVRRARRRFSGPGRRFSVAKSSPRVADYSLASGIMNISCGHSRADWESYVATTLREMRRTSRAGFAVNFITEAARPDIPDDPAATKLYRTAAKPWVRFCERELGCAVQTLDGYGMKEFTLLVRCPPVATAGIHQHLSPDS